MNSVLQLGTLDAATFEQMVNSLAMEVLGHGVSSFGPGPDGGRDGLFVGTAPYPSETEHWSGTWFLQSKFHYPNLSSDHHGWLVSQVKRELHAFQENSRREWPDIWIVATNIDPSGAPDTGAYDKCCSLVREARPELADRFAIWGGNKILDLLTKYPHIAERYGHFLTPGSVLAELMSTLKGQFASYRQITRSLIEDSLIDSRSARLEQAGDSTRRLDIHRLFIDLPARSPHYRDTWRLIGDAALACAEHHRPTAAHENPPREWANWHSHPKRSATWLILAGPGRGKSTLGQFLCQVHRAAIVLAGGSTTDPEATTLASDIKQRATELGVWPLVPRVPLHIDLSRYAHWKAQNLSGATGILSFLAAQLHISTQEHVTVNSLRQLMSAGRFLVVCDGLDEVPADIKRDVSHEVIRFNREARRECDLMMICTSRPQGYEGQLDELQGSKIELVDLDVNSALECATRLLEAQTTKEEADKGRTTIAESIESAAVKQLMVTPLQVHIMTIIVRQGHRPPEKKWELFRRFYEVIYQRESSKPLAGAPEARLLRDETKMVATVHRALGFVLHARAETNAGSLASLSQSHFRELAAFIVGAWKEDRIDELTDTLCRSATERLVLINTPDSKESVRFDVRQLQEFFAAEFLIEGTDNDALRERIRSIALDSHWREVFHFLLSSIIERDRKVEIAIALQALREANERSLYGDAPSIGRQLLAGSLAAATLLADGVLEPDKRIRDQFRDLISLLGARDSSLHISPLLKIKKGDSMTWTINVMKERLRAFNPEFSVGASVVVFCLSPQDAQDICSLWGKWPSDQRQRAFKLLTEVGLTTSIPASALIYLLSDSHLGITAAKALFDDFFPFWNLSELLIDELSKTDPDCARIVQFFHTLARRPSSERNRGWLTFFESPDASMPPQDVIDASARTIASTDKGFFSFAATAIQFLATEHRLSYIAILARISSAQSPPPALVNFSLYGHLPLEADRASTQDLMDTCQKMSDADFTAGLRTGRIGDVTLPIARSTPSIHHGSGTTSQLAHLLKTDPYWMVFVLVTNEDAMACLGDVGQDVLEEFIRENISSIAKFPALWGRLQDFAGSDFRSALRLALCNTTNELRWGGFRENHICFCLEFPSDNPLLIPIAHAMATSLSHGYLGPVSLDLRPMAHQVDRARANAARWVLRIGDLHSLVAGGDDSEMAVCATIVGALHPEGGVHFVTAHIDAIARAMPHCRAASAVALVRVIDAIDGLKQPECLSIVDQIISTHESARWEMQLIAWHSRAVGTVSKSGKVAEWLGVTHGLRWLLAAS